MSGNDVTENERPRQPEFGINPEKLYTLDEIRQIFKAGEDIGRKLEAAGFKWLRPKWAPSRRFTLGAKLIEFIERTSN